MECMDLSVQELSTTVVDAIATANTFINNVQDLDKAVKPVYALAEDMCVVH